MAATLAARFDIDSGRRLIERTVVVMAGGTIRFNVVSFIPMAISTIGLGVGVIQLQAGDGMTEVLLIPGTMTGDAVGPQAGNSFPGRMASATLKLGMVLVEGPAGRIMGERRFLPGIVAGFTAVGGVTPGTDGVHLGLRFGRSDRFFDIMTSAAVFLGMAINAFEIEQLGMIIMEKGDDRFLLIRGIVNPFLRLDQANVRDTDDVGAVD